MAVIFQLAKDEFTHSADAPGSTAKWKVLDTEDELVVDTLITSTIPTTDGFGNPLIDAVPKHLGAGAWDIDVRYGPIPPLATGLTLWEVDTTGGREKKYQSLATRYQQLPTGASAPIGGNAGVAPTFGAIGQTESGPEGVDVAVPKLQLTAKRKFKNNSLPSNYIEELEGITATINAATFSIAYWGQSLLFDAGELLFLGAVVSIATETELEVDCRFEASRDRLVSQSNGVTVAQFTNPVSKPGWDYAWFSYARTAGNNQRMSSPTQYQSEKVYPDGDFTVLIL